MNDDVLWQCNETELLWMARNQGLGFLKRGLPKQELVSIVAGYVPPKTEQFADTMTSRKVLEGFIHQNWGIIQSQLPGCNGKCRKFPCSEGKHALCFFATMHLVHL